MAAQHAAITDTISRASMNRSSQLETGETPIDQVRQLERTGDVSAEQKNFAVAMGFDSFTELLKASHRVESNDGQNWYLTPLVNSTWGAWNDAQLQFDRHYSTEEEALANIPHEAETTGTAMLG